MDEIDNLVDGDDHAAMRSFIALAAFVVTAPAFAHPGHALTPAHVHVGTGALDVGSLIIVGAVASAIWTAVRQARRG